MHHLAPVTLPAQPTSLIGRTQEVAQVCALLRSPEVRLLTLVGTAGTGKTRLAIAVAEALLDDFEHGVFFVDLTTAASAADVVPSIARVLGLQDLGNRVLVDRLDQYLASRRPLLVLDNFEHVLGAGAQIAELLTRCPLLKLLVTSRAALRLRWEQEFPVLPLAVPNPVATPSAAAIAAVPSVMLFVQRAQSARPDFALTDQNAAAVAAICQRLDGLPLAIELAAVRTKLLPPQALLPRLDSRLAMLIDGPRELPARRQTLRGAIGWSYDLLTPTEQALFRHLAVFAGGFTASAAEAVCDSQECGPVLETIAALVDHSLLRVQATPEGEPRFVMLETLREFASERLSAAGEVDALQRRHALYFLRIAEEAEPHLTRADREVYVGRLESEYENLRTALAWLLEHQAGALACRLAGALGWFWYFQGRVSDGRRWLERALDAVDACNNDRSKALAGAGHIAWLQGDNEAARRWCEEAIAVARPIRDLRSLTSGLVHLALIPGGVDDAYAARLIQEAVAVSIDLHDPFWEALALHTSGVFAFGRGDLTTSRARLEESLRLWQQLGDTAFAAQTLNSLGDVGRLEGDYPRAEALYARSLALLREHGVTTGVPSVLHNLGYVAHHQGDHRRSLGLFLDGLEMFVIQGDQRGIAECLVGVAIACLGLGQPHDAARMFGAGEALLESIGSPPWPSNLGAVQAGRARASAQMPPAEFAEVWAAGRAMGPERALRYVRDLAAGEQPAPAPVSRPGLTPREQEIAVLLARGFSNRQLAENLVITEQTAETHVKRILGKLELHSRHQVAEWASRAGLTP